MSSLRQNRYFLWTFSISVIISADPVSYFLKMIVLISLVVDWLQSETLTCLKKKKKDFLY